MLHTDLCVAINCSVVLIVKEKSVVIVIKEKAGTHCFAESCFWATRGAGALTSALCVACTASKGPPGLQCVSEGEMTQWTP